ncbi:MAG TPA: amidohydrolase family protein, partial [Pilimelia sp.]|nr:amidohydrolase family protein [Pilimelia sp.]
SGDGAGRDAAAGFARLRVIGVKIFADGIPPMRSAYTHRCYADGGRAALLVRGGDDAEREANLGHMIIAAHRAGLQVGVHATGDRSIDVVLDAVQRARAERDVDLAHYVIHGDLVTPAQLRRMAALGVGLSAQPGIAVCTHGLVDQALGAGAGAAAWPLRAALEAGIPLCLSSDAPVLSPDWRRQIAAADEWMGPASDVRGRMETLLRCYTVHPAGQDRAAAWKGTLAPGMAADLCVLAADPFGVSPAELPDVEVDLTVLAGEVVHERRVRSIA